MKAFGKRAMAAALIVVLLLGSGALTGKATADYSAYSLKAPTITAEQFSSDTGIKVFINGRCVEFNDDMGYPYIENGRVMIPLRAVAETYNAYVDYWPGSKVAVVYKHHERVEVKIDYDKNRYRDNDDNYTVITTDANAVIKNDRTYIPLRAVFECFGLNVRWDQETRTAHIEMIGDQLFPNIDFKGEKTVSIQDVNLDEIDSAVYDEEEVPVSYLNVLKNSNQYKVIIKDGTARIFSYQFLSELDYFYAKAKELEKCEDICVDIETVNRDEFLFFTYLSDMSWVSDDNMTGGSSRTRNDYSFYTILRGEKKKK